MGRCISFDRPLHWLWNDPDWGCDNGIWVSYYKNSANPSDCLLEDYDTSRLWTGLTSTQPCGKEWRRHLISLLRSYYAYLPTRKPGKGDSKEENKTFPMIYGSDRDAGAITAAKTNAERAGVSNIISFHHHAFSDVPEINSMITRYFAKCSEPLGWIISNLPYGIRIATKDKRNLYAQLGKVRTLLQ